MGTLVKYIFYIILIVVVYLVGRGVMEGDISKQTTVGEVIDQVDSGSKQLMDKTGAEIKEGYDATKADVKATK